MDRDKVFAELESRLSRNIPLVILVGQGGMGKSTSLADWVARVLKNEPGAMVKTIHARNLESGWVADTVRNWSQITGLFQSTDMEEAIRRLDIANRDDSWTLYLIVDGLDESQNDVNGAIRPLLAKFIEKLNTEARDEPPKVVLIGTCRDMDALIDFMDNSGVTPPQIAEECFLDVGPFNDDEFSRAVNQLPESDAKIELQNIISSGKLLNSLAMSGSFGYGDSTQILSTVDGTQPFAPPVDGENDHVIALQQPVFWSFFKNMDDGAKLDYLERSEAGLVAFAEQLVAWFSRKFQRRNVAEWSPQIIRRIMVRVTQETSSVANPNISIIENIMRELGMSAPDAYLLHSEAVSAGIFQSRGVDGWRWSSSIIPNSLDVLGTVSS